MKVFDLQQKEINRLENRLYKLRNKQDIYSAMQRESTQENLKKLINNFGTNK